MKLEGYAYVVSARVTLRREELKVLIKLSGYHYDRDCVAAGMLTCEQHPHVGLASENGFLAILLMNPDDEVAAVWPFDQLDITAKILEQRGVHYEPGIKERLTLDALDKKVREVMDGIRAEHERLTRKERGR